MIHESECGMRNERRRFNLSNEVDVFYDPVFFIFFFFTDEEKEDRQLRIIEARNSIRFA